MIRRIILSLSLAILMTESAWALPKMSQCVANSKLSEIKCLHYYRMHTKMGHNNKQQAEHLRKECQRFSNMVVKQCFRYAILRHGYFADGCNYLQPDIPNAAKTMKPNLKAVKCFETYQKKKQQCFKKLKILQVTQRMKRHRRGTFLRHCQKKPKEALKKCAKTTISQPLPYPLLDRPLHDIKLPWLSSMNELPKHTDVFVCGTPKGQKAQYFRGKLLGPYTPNTPLYNRLKKEWKNKYDYRWSCVSIRHPRRIRQCTWNRFVLPIDQVKLRYPTKEQYQMRESRQKILAIFKENHALFKELAQLVKEGKDKKTLNDLKQLTVPFSDKQHAIKKVSLKDGDIILQFKKAYLGKPLTLSIIPLENFRHGHVFYNCLPSDNDFKSGYLPDICRFPASPFHYHFEI